MDDRADPRMVRIHLKQSKTDQFGKGADIVLGRTGLDLCPVAAVLGYIAARGDSPGPFFVDSRSRPVFKSSFVQAVRGVIASLGLAQDQFAGHSFRIGAATAAAMAGAEDLTIQLLGRWHSTAFLRYVRTPPERLAALVSYPCGTQQQATGATPRADTETQRQLLSSSTACVSQSQYVLLCCSVYALAVAGDLALPAVTRDLVKWT